MYAPQLRKERPAVSQALEISNLPLAALPTGTVLDLVRDVVRSELAAISPSAPALLDREGLAQQLGISTGMVDKLRRHGLPTVWLGDSPRFILVEVLAWLPR
jgi:hypothetical protein